jgi:hypothetical protein
LVGNTLKEAALHLVLHIAETPVGQKQTEQNSTVKSLASSLQTGADTLVQPIVKFLDDKVLAAGRGKIVTTLPISETERQQARAILDAEKKANEQTHANDEASGIKNGETDNGGSGSGSGRGSRQQSAGKANTHNPNGESMSPKFAPKWIRDAHLILVRILAPALAES